MGSKKLKPKDRKKTAETIPLERENFVIFFIGVLVLIVGYIFLAQGPATSFWSLTLAPILLVIGYCIIIPVAIVYRRRKAKAADNQQQAEIA
ncbi:MAG: DUF3098 domain-containing protein [candidate division KSB1 bacterium]|nr:DUF3098 domain-containing protein [candidate division KSB1 bacterium]MDZ7340281.1 DUF3098 domain-containing protein [candidate division KSB1 bacterium]